MVVNVHYSQQVYIQLATSEAYHVGLFSKNTKKNIHAAKSAS